MYEIECGGAVARSITIKQPTNYLTLCEVKAYGKPSDGVPLLNVASGKIFFDCVHLFSEDHTVLQDFGPVKNGL